MEQAEAVQAYSAVDIEIAAVAAGTAEAEPAGVAGTVAAVVADIVVVAVAVDIVVKAVGSIPVFAVPWAIAPR